jgi:hypothetical protein
VPWIFRAIRFTNTPSDPKGSRAMPLWRWRFSLLMTRFNPGGPFTQSSMKALPSIQPKGIEA